MMHFPAEQRVFFQTMYLVKEVEKLSQLTLFASVYQKHLNSKSSNLERNGFHNAQSFIYSQWFSLDRKGLKNYNLRSNCSCQTYVVE